MVDKSQVPSTEEDTPILVTWLRERDAPCRCGYNLRNLSSAICPECGVGLRLTVAVADDYVKAWHACSAVAYAAAGIGTVVTVLMSIGLYRHSVSLPPKEFAWLVFFISSLPIAGALAGFRRRFQSSARWFQWLLTAICTAYFGTMVGVFVVLLQ